MGLKHVTESQPVVVVGLGLIGGSLARGLRSAGIPVLGYDPDPETLQSAAEQGILVMSDLSELAGQRIDVVVLAVPLRAVDSTMRTLSTFLDPEATVTDVGSVKSAVRAAAVASGLGTRYVGAHPMAGTEKSGYAASSAELLNGVTWAVTVAAETTSVEVPEHRHLSRVLDLITGALAGQALILTDSEHDATVALISHLPHVFAAELAASAAASPLQSVAALLAAGSFRDGTRVAHTDPARTQAMIEHNGAQVAAAVRLAARDLLVLADDLEAEAETEWFFVRGFPNVARHGDTTHEATDDIKMGHRVLWSDDWTGALLAAGRAACPVVGVDAEGVTLAEPSVRRG